MAVDPNAVQIEALRLKNAGDPRPLPMIIAALSATMEQAPPAPVAAPTEMAQQPMPQPEVSARPAMPPMQTPYSPVEKARQVAPEEPATKGAAAPTITATDAAIKNAQDKGDPLAAAMAEQEAYQQRARQSEMDAIARIREETGADPRLDALLKRREERFAKEEAALAADEKQQAWDALIMTGLKMAQTTSPYFAAALAEGLQAGIDGYSSSKAASAEKKARLEDARDGISLERIKSEDSMEQRAISDRAAAEASSVNALTQRAKRLEIAIAQTREPAIRAKMEAELKQTYAQIQSTQYRDALAGRADARAASAAARAASGDSGQAAYAKAYRSGIADEAEYGRKFAETAMEGSDLRPGDPGYMQAYQTAVSEGRSIYRNSNPQWSSLANQAEGVATLQRPKTAPPPAPKKKEESFFSRLNPFD